MAARSGDKDLIGTQSTTLLGVKISQYSRPFQLVFCSTSIFISFLLNGICEEYVFRKLQFSYAWCFTLVQCSVYVVLAYLQGGWQMKVNTPWKTFLILAFVWVGSVGLTKGSLRYINYPTQIMFKSSKYPKVYVIIGSAAVATYIGQLAILALIALFGAAAAYMVTSLRKAFTLCLSYLIFTKPLNTDHLIGIILIFVSISMKMCLNPKKKESGPPVERGTEESVNLNAALDESENNI